MKRKCIGIITILLVLYPAVAFGHPGNTDSNGGHTCKTNCAEWGLYYGEYHYHDDNYYDAQAEYDEGYDKGYEIAYRYTSECTEEYEWWWEGTQDYGDGFEDGIVDGHADGLNYCLDISYEAGFGEGEYDSKHGIDYDEDNSYEYSYDFNSYVEGYADGFDETIYEEVVDSKKEEGTARAKVEQESVTSTVLTKDDNDFPYQVIVFFGLVVGVGIVSSLYDKYKYKRG
ncbi:YHYH domain-containing protein [Bacillus sp. HNG]|nr:YHYH domain-containing protein [Bacillus sp. HNG]